MREKITDVGDMCKQASHQRIIARFADGDALEGSVLDGAQLVVKLVDEMAVLGAMVLKRTSAFLDAADQGNEAVKP